MLRIGLTGGIAAGKTAVSDRLAARGATIIDTDVLSREVVAPGEAVLAEIVEAFGSTVLLPDGTLNRTALGQRIFADELARQALNAILHPRIRARMLSQLQAVAERPVPPPAVVLVVPLLFENGLEVHADESWVVDLPDAVRRERLMRRNGLSEAEAQARIDSQMSRAERLERATRVIDNSGEMKQLDTEIERVWRAAGLP